MGNIKIIKGVFDTKLELEHAGVAAGFPSPADEYRHETLDFNRDYIRHPEASFYGDVEGDSMKDAGLWNGDRVIIDRAVEPRDGSIVVAWWGVVSIIRQETPTYFRYSIDECFMYLDGIKLDKLQQWGENLHKRVKREVGMPISIGLAPNKTLAKIASKLAKIIRAWMMRHRQANCILIPWPFFLNIVVRALPESCCWLPRNGLIVWGYRFCCCSSSPSSRRWPWAHRGQSSSSSPQRPPVATCHGR